MSKELEEQIGLWKLRLDVSAPAPVDELPANLFLSDLRDEVKALAYVLIKGDIAPPTSAKIIAVATYAMNVNMLAAEHTDLSTCDAIRLGMTYAACLTAAVLGGVYAVDYQEKEGDYE